MLYLLMRILFTKLARPFSILKIQKIQNNKEQNPQMKLHLGSGPVHLSGWINIDSERGADLILDIRKKIPFSDNSVDYIYSEHFIEHLTYKETNSILRDCCRCLKPGGIIRIATPDLDDAIQKYNKDWRNQDWLSWPEYQFIKTRGMMMNVSFYYWGHKFLFNEEDLTNQLTEAGLGEIKRCEWGKSDYSELNKLETRIDSKLIIEGRKIN